MKKYFDKTSIILTLFIIVLSGLLFYLNKVESHIQAYTSTQKKVISLQLYNQEFDQFSDAINHFSNYDIINKSIKNFEINLNALNQHIQSQYGENIELQNILKKTYTVFSEKKADLEYFKSLNAIVQSNAHFLFDLQRSISDDKKISLHTKYLVNEILFYLLRFTTSEYIDKNFIKKKLFTLEKQTHFPHIYTFYHQSLTMIKHVHQLKKLTKTIQNSHLYTLIGSLEQQLFQSYQNYLYIQKIITFLFFISALLTVLILLAEHTKNKRKAQELLAFQYAVQHSDNTIIITDEQKRITFVNDVFEKVTGYTKEEVMGKNPSILKSKKQHSSVYRKMNIQLNKGEKWEGELINQKKDGSLFYEKASIVPIFLDNTLMSYLAIKLDITHYIEQNIKLAQAASVFDNTEESIIITDAQGNIQSVNQKFYEIYHYTQDEIIGTNLRKLYENTNRIVYEEIWSSVQAYGIWKGKMTTHTKEGTQIPMWSTVKQVQAHDTDAINYIAIQTDLRELENSQAKADFLAYHDPLTKLYNRASFEEYIEHLFKKKQKDFAIFFIDLDRFKVINDTLGHDIGDQVLLTVAQRLKNTLKHDDFISRWGGDEFVIILENMHNKQEYESTAQNIIEALRVPLEIKHHHLIITASIGIAIYPSDGDDPSSLIKHADTAMYLAKESGKNRYKFYTNVLSNEIQTKLDIDIALHNAIKNKEFYIMLQPQYDLKTKKIIAYEALIRWENHDMGNISPDIFIPVAEDSGTIIPLGYYIFDQAAQSLKILREHGFDIKYIAVNFSSIQFKQQDLLEHLMQIIQKYKLAPSDFELEITERFIMEHTQDNIAMLQEFQRHGFKISVDDFGTGYSSMAYLKQLPVDAIKIDKSFIADIDIHSHNNHIVEAILALIKTLGYSVVAEGIETTYQEEFLLKHGCDIGQGYLVGKPLKIDDILQNLKD